MIDIVVFNNTELSTQEFNMADYQYMRIINQIKDYGKWDKNPRPRWDDGTPAYRKSILNARMQFNYGRNKDEMPMLTTKKVAQKDPINEGFWIWRDKSNKVQDLRDMGCKVWNQWELPDGTIGKSYGWQLRHNRRKVEVTEELIEMIEDGRLAYGRYFDDVRYLVRNLRRDMNDPEFKSFVIFIDQVDFILYKLATDPYSTRLKTSLWGVEDLDNMALEPCVYDTHFQYDGDELHLTVNIRSNDMALTN